MLSGFQNQYGSVVQYHCNEPFYSLPKGVNGEIFLNPYENNINKTDISKLKVNGIILFPLQVLSPVRQTESGDPNTTMSLQHVYLVLKPFDI